MSNKVCENVQKALNQNRITEDAAIVVISLVIHELEGLVLDSVVEIGGGGDYAVVAKQTDMKMQVEVSGVREDATGKYTHSRLQQKRKQVLKTSPTGFASVTTFAYGDEQQLRSYLHYAENARKDRKTKRAKTK